MDYNTALFNADNQQTPIPPSPSSPKQSPDNRPGVQPAQSPDETGPAVDAIMRPTDAIMRPTDAIMRPTPSNNLSLPYPELSADSIFNKIAFPHRTKKFEFTPQNLKTCLEYYAYSGENLKNCCAAHNIPVESLRELQDLFPEIDAFHVHAQERKADSYFEGSIATAEDESNLVTTVTKTCKNGDTLEYEQGNMVDVRHRELKQKSYLIAAERLSARYRPKSELTTKNLNVNINSKPVDLANLNANDLS